MRQLLKELSQKPIAYYPIYRKITGSTTGGILLSQLMYWFSKKNKIFKTDTEIMEETLLTKKEMENAKKLIKKLDFIIVSREGIPAKTYYEIEWDLFENYMIKNIENRETSCTNKGKQVSTNGGNCTPPMVETNKNNNFNTETTTETTTEKTSKKVKTTPFDIIAFYRENISSQQEKIREQKSFNLLALKANELEVIFTGLKNYKEYLELRSIEEKFIKSLKNFIEDKIYLDFQKEIKNKETAEWDSYGLDYDHNKEWK